MSFCLLKEKSLCLGTGYKTKESQFARESVGLCPFHGSYLREFELSHSNPINRIIKISYAHNLHVMLDFGPFVHEKCKLFTRKFSQTILRNHLRFTTSVFKLCSMQCQG